MAENIVDSNEDFKTAGGFEKETFDVTVCDIEDLEIANVQLYSGIPAYLDITESLYPVVIKTPEGYFLADGHELLEEASVRGRDKVKCFVYYLDEHDDAEISLFILGVRTKPQGGSARYAEIIRNVRICKNKLNETNGNLSRHSQGGRRRGQAFNEADKSGNINFVLIARTGRGRGSVGDYLAHSDFIDDNTLNLLAEGIKDQSPKDNGDVDVTDRGASRSFFRNIHAKKRASIMKLQGEKVDDNEIVETISAKVLAAFKEDKTGKKVTVFDDLVGEKVEKPPKKVKETVPATVEASAVNPAESVGSLQKEVQSGVSGDSHPVATATEYHPSGASTTEEHRDEIGKTAEVVNIAPPQPVYIKLLEVQAAQLLEIARSEKQPFQIGENVEQVIAALTEVLTIIRTFTEDSYFRKAA